MKLQPRKIRLLAGALSFLAGFVDAVAYLSVGGFFVSFMSGNSTRLGAGIAEWSAHASMAGGLIASFVLGVTVGALVARHRSGRSVLAVVTLFLVLGAVAGSTHAPLLAAGFAALAMGAVNATFTHEGGLPVGLTYMTGTLVRLGQSVAASIAERRAFDGSAYALHWMALIGGAIAGGLAQQRWGLQALWLPACAAAAMAVMAPLKRST